MFWLYLKIGISYEVENIFNKHSHCKNEQCDKWNYTVSFACLSNNR